MANEIFAQIFGVIASITLIISALSVHRVRLMVFALATSILVAVQIALVGGTLSTLLICIIGVVRTLAVLLSDLKWPVLRHWSLAVIFIVASTAVFVATNDITALEWFNWMPLFGAYAGTLALFFSNMAITKSLFIAAGGLWIGYYLSVQMLTQIIGETFTIAANIVALVVVLRSQHAGIKDDDMVDVVDVVTEAIPILTGKIKTVTTSIRVIKDDSPTSPVTQLGRL